MNSNNNLSYNLRKILTSRNMTALELSKECNIFIGVVKNAITNSNGTSLRTLDRIAAGLNINPSDLINLDMRPKND